MFNTHYVQYDYIELKSNTLWHEIIVSTKLMLYFKLTLCIPHNFVNTLLDSVLVLYIYDGHYIWEFLPLTTVVTNYI